MLRIRISPSDFCFARYEPLRPDDFSFATFPTRQQASLTMNLREAIAQTEMLQNPYDAVEVLLTEATTPVPLAEFQEEDCETLYRYCFAAEGKYRVFYDTVPASNLVLLFALDEMTCHTLDETFGKVRYTTAVMPVLQHFSQKGLGTTEGKRLFVNLQEKSIDIAVFEASRLTAFNHFKVHGIADIAYYALNMARHQGLDTTDSPFFIAGPGALRTQTVEELGQYASRVYGINPASEFNRNPVALTENMPYDLMCHLLRTQYRS